jgi:hypothetical protein
MKGSGKGVSHSNRGSLTHTGKHVRVCAHGLRDGGMPEEFLHELGMLSQLQEYVAQIVDTHRAGEIGSVRGAS